MRLFRLLLLFTFCALPSLFAAACAPALLSVYDTSGFTCQVNAYTVKDFVYSQISGTILIPDTAITVTPVFGVNTLGLQFSSNQFTVSGTDTAKYLLAYTWDPGDIRGFTDFLDTDPPVFPGLAKISTDLCEDAAFIGPLCSMTTANVTVSDNGVTLIHSASVAFSPSIGTVGVRNTIELDGNGASAVFTSFTNDLVVPEPATSIGCLLALGLLGLRLRRRDPVTREACSQRPSPPSFVTQ